MRPAERDDRRSTCGSAAVSAMRDDDAIIRLDQGGINARILAKETREDFRRVESAKRKIQTTRCSPEVKRLFVRHCNSMQLNMYLISVNKFLKFPMNIIRPSNAYCPGQLLHRVIPKAVVCGLTGRKLPLQGGGRAEKSYIHARDLGRAIHLVAEKAPLGTVYNAGPREPTSIRRVDASIAVSPVISSR